MTKLSSLFLGIICFMCISPGISLAEKCDVVAYMAWTGINSSDVYLSEKWTKETLMVPEYLGVLCIDNTKKHITIYPKISEDLFAMSYFLHRIKLINEPSTKVIGIFFREEEDGDPNKVIFIQGALFNARKDSPKFPSYVLRNLGIDAYEPMRIDYDAEPDLEWKPVFKEQYTYAEYQKKRMEDGFAIAYRKQLLEVQKQYITPGPAFIFPTPRPKPKQLDMESTRTSPGIWKPRFEDQPSEKK